MAIIKLISGRHFIANSEVTLLEAASSAGVAFPYSCRTGRCASCKAHVRYGQTRAIADEPGLSRQDKDAGWILTCVRVAESDVDLEIDDLGGINLPVPKTLPCRIEQLDRVAPDIVLVKLRLPPASKFTFLPGQYIDIIADGGIRRSYSLANFSHPNNILELHVRRVRDGQMSHYWFDRAKKSDLIRLYGPLGTFFLREHAANHVFFLATGTGIAPVKAMLESLISVPEDRHPPKITVLWGGRRPEDFYIDIAAIPGNHRFIPVISRPNEGWSGTRGYVQDALLSNASDLGKAAVYACGSNDMICSARAALTAAGLPAARFYSDAFVSSGGV